MAFKLLQVFFFLMLINFIQNGSHVSLWPQENFGKRSVQKHFTWSVELGYNADLKVSTVFDELINPQQLEQNNRTML